MTAGWVALIIAAGVALLLVGDWLLAGRTKRRLTSGEEGRRLSRRSTAVRDDVRASSQNNATRNSISGGGTSG